MDEVQDCIDRNFDAVRKKMGRIAAEETMAWAESFGRAINEQHAKDEQLKLAQGLRMSFTDWCNSLWAS